MRHRWAIAVPVIALSVAGGVFALPSASGKTDIHVISGPSSEIVSHFLKGDLRAADRVQSRGPLYDETQTNRLGTSYGDCVVHKRILSGTKGLWGCNYVLDLGDGTIVLQGLDPRGPGTYEMAVLGGTGVYVGASGDATFNDVGTDENAYTDMVIRLIVP